MKKTRTISNDLSAPEFSSELIGDEKWMGEEEGKKARKQAGKELF